MVVCAVAVIIQSSNGASHTWSGSIDALWSKSGNWSAGGVPSTNEGTVTLTFPSGAASHSTNDIAGLSIDVINFTGTGFNVGGIGSGTSLNLAGSVTNAVNTTNTIGSSLQLTLKNQVTFAVNGRLIVSSAISGTNGLYKFSAGNLVFSGIDANSYTGTTYIEQGVLELGKSFLGFGVNSIVGPLVIGDPVYNYTAVVRLTFSAQIGNSVPVTVRTSSGELVLNGYGDTIGSLTMQDGIVDTQGGTLAMYGNITASGTAYMYGALSLGATNRTFNVLSGSSFFVNADIQDGGNSAGITFNGPGTVRFGGSNSFAGPLLINSGVLDAQTSYALGATNSGTTVASGAQLYINNHNFTNEQLTISGNSSVNGALQFRGTNLWLGKIVLPATAVFAAGLTNAKFSCADVISGPGGITLTNGGTLVFNSLSPNTYTGTTTVDRGKLILAAGLIGFSGVPAMAGPLVIGNNVDNSGSALVQCNLSSELGSNVPVTVYPSGKLDLNDHSDTVGALNLYGGSVDSGTGTLTLGGDIAVLQSYSTPSVLGILSLGGATRNINMVADVSFLLYAQIVDGSGSAGITLNGQAGSGLFLYNTNTYSGVTTVNGGYLSPVVSQSLGASSGGTVINSGGTLALNEGLAIMNEPLTVSGAGGGLGAVTASGSAYWGGSVSLAGDSVFAGLGNSSYLTFGGPISGPGGVTITNTGSVTFQGSTDNTYLGPTIVKSGVLYVQKTSGNVSIPGALVIGTSNVGTDSYVAAYTHNQIVNNSTVTVNRSGSLVMTSVQDTIGSLTLAGGSVDAGIGGLLTLNGNIAAVDPNNVSHISGAISLGGVNRIIDTTGPLQILATIADGGGSAGFTKTGSSWLYLDNSNSYSGLTIVSNGLLGAHNNYALGSSAAGTIVASGTVLELVTANITNESLTISGAAQSSSIEAVYTNTWAGPVTLLGDTTLSVASSNTWLTIAGPISGNGDVNITGVGLTTFGGNTANTFSGTTTARGYLYLSKPNGVLAVPGPLVIGVTNPPLADYVVLLNSKQIASNAPVTIYQSGQLALNGNAQTVASLSLYDSSVVTGNGVLTLNGNVTQNVGTTHGFITGNISLGGTNRIFTVTSNAYLDVYAQISDGGNNAGFTMTGGGGLGLGMSNSYAGVTTVAAGYINVWNASSFGATNGGTVVQDGAAISLRNGVSVGREPLTLTGTGITGTGALTVDGTNSWSGDITLAGNTAMSSSYPNTRTTLSGVISGSGNFTLLCDGTVQFTGSANTYSGTTFLKNGTLELNKTNGNAIAGNLVIDPMYNTTTTARLLKANQISDQSAVTVDNSGVFDLNNFSETVGSIGGSGTVNCFFATLTTGGNGNSTTFSGTMNGSSISMLTKNGIGTMTFSGYSGVGGGVINNGTFVVNGTFAGPLQLINGATLSGGGTVGSVSSSGAAIAPGNSVGKLNTGALTFNPETSTYFELNSTTNYDQLNVTGTAAIGGTLNLNVNFVSALSNQFALIKNDGVDLVTGAFIGLSEGTTFVKHGAVFKISYIGGDGNDVVITQVTPTIGPVLTSITRSTNGAALQGTGLAGGAYTVEASFNLQNWAFLGDIVADGSGLLQFVDNSATNYPYRFYHLVAH